MRKNIQKKNLVLFLSKYLHGFGELFRSNQPCCHNISVLKPTTKREILDSSKLKEFADDNFKFDENGRKLSKQVENTVGKGEYCVEYWLKELQESMDIVWSTG